MTIRIVYGGKFDVVVDCVESIRLAGPATLVTNTFGNGPVTHRNVTHWELVNNGLFQGDTK